MTAPVSDLAETAPPSRPRRRRWVWVSVVAVVAVVVAFALLMGLGTLVYHARESRPVPTFVSLAEHPDSALQGTVAYYASGSGCVRIVAAAGQPSKDVLCLPATGPSTWVKEGKPVGPQLVWLPDNRLEVTMFRMKPGASAGGLSPGWQKIVDVQTGKVEDVPTADVPSAANLTTHPTVSPRGERLSWTSDEATGRVKVMLTDSAGTRTLLSAHGPGEYTYRLTSVFWAANWQWIAADDGRILVITPSDPAVTRVLVESTGGGAGGGTAGPTFAVTAANMLTAPATGPPDVLVNALNTGDTTRLRAYLATSVSYAIAASGAYGTTSAADAARRIVSYLHDARGPWNFAMPADDLNTLKHGSYGRYLADDTYFGVSPDRMFISVRVNAAGRIDQVFMAANTDLLR